MKKISKLEKEKISNLLECSEHELDILNEKSDSLYNLNSNTYENILKVLQQGFNIREATLAALNLGQIIGYEKAKIEMEEEIKDKLYNAFRNNH
jgi:hypothetical protein